MDGMPRPQDFEDYLRHVALERGLAKNTVAAYRTDVGQFLDHLEAAGIAPRAASPDVIGDYLWGLSQRGLRPATLFRKVESLRSFYGFLAAEGRVPDDPTRHVRAPKVPEKLPDYLSEAEVERLMDMEPGASFDTVRTKALLELLYATGARVSELLGLRPEALNLSERWIRVYGKGGKERVIPFHERAKKALARWLRVREARFSAKPSDGELFVNRRGGKLDRSRFWRDLSELGKRAGLDGVHPHLLRHSFATHLLRKGADLRAVQELLGHSSLTTTQIYTHLERSALKNAHEKHHPRR